jgi:hypothetical protein
MYKKKCELRTRWDNYTGDKCKYHTFASRVNLYWMDKEKAISPYKMTKKIWDVYTMIEKIRIKNLQYQNWLVPKTLHSEVLKKKEKSDFTNIVTNKMEAEVILREYEKMMDKLENTVYEWPEDLIRKEKELDRLTNEYENFLDYINTHLWYEQ